MTLYDQLAACKHDEKLYAAIKRLAPLHTVSLWRAIQSLMPGLTVGQAKEFIEYWRADDRDRKLRECPSFLILVDAINNLIGRTQFEAFTEHCADWADNLIAASGIGNGRIRFEVIIGESRFAREFDPVANEIEKWILEVLA